jgi:hypothetical protein
MLYSIAPTWIFALSNNLDVKSHYSGRCCECAWAVCAEDELNFYVSALSKILLIAITIIHVNSPQFPHYHHCVIGTKLPQS